jgi:hypothetical protein
LNSYQVNYVRSSETGQVVASSLYIEAMTREEAVYAAFDELADQGTIDGLEFCDVLVKHDSGKYIEIFEHKQVSKT